MKIGVDLTGDYRTTIYAAARRAVAEGADPSGEIATYRNGTLSMRGNIGRCAEIDVSDPASAKGMRMVKWRPFPTSLISGACGAASMGADLPEVR